MGEYLLQAGTTMVLDIFFYFLFFFIFSLAVQGRFVWIILWKSSLWKATGPTHWALANKCEYAVNSLKVGGSHPVLNFCKVEAWRALGGFSKIWGMCAHHSNLQHPVGLHQHPRPPDDVLMLQKTWQCPFLLKHKCLSPEIWLQACGTELHNCSLISNLVSAL